MLQRRIYNSGINISNTEGLIFHAPLDEEHGLRDVISGKSFVINNSSWFSFDTKEGKYKFTASRNNLPAYIDSLDLPIFNNGKLGNCTLCVKVKPINYIWSYISICDFYNLYGMLVSKDQEPIGPVGEETIQIRSFDGKNINQYVNDKLVLSSGFQSIDDVCSKITIGFTPNFNGSGQSYIRDIRLYNRTLTTSEIEQLYKEM